MQILDYIAFWMRYCEFRKRILYKIESKKILSFLIASTSKKISN